MTDNLFSLDGKVAVVAVAAQGLGRATALALARYWADVVLVDRNVSGAEATAAEIAALGRRSCAIPIDVSDPKAIAEMYRQVDQKFGRVDFLGNIAGDGHWAQPESLTMEDLRRGV